MSILTRSLSPSCGDIQLLCVELNAPFWLWDKVLLPSERRTSFKMEEGTGTNFTKQNRKETNPGRGCGRAFGSRLIPNLRDPAVAARLRHRASWLDSLNWGVGLLLFLGFFSFFYFFKKWDSETSFCLLCLCSPSPSRSLAPGLVWLKIVSN